MKYLIILITCVACATTPTTKSTSSHAMFDKKHKSQDHFWVGCMNGYIRNLQEPIEEKVIKQADLWCKDIYKNIENR